MGLPEICVGDVFYMRGGPFRKKDHRRLKKSRLSTFDFLLCRPFCCYILKNRGVRTNTANYQLLLNQPALKVTWMGKQGCILQQIE